MGLRILHVSHALSRVSADAVGGAEQILATLDEALSGAGHASAVVAPAGSRAAGRLFPSCPVAPPFDVASEQAALRSQAGAVRRALAAGGFDLVHLHGLHLEGVLPEPHPPAVATLHLPPGWYPPAALSRRPGLALACVSETQARDLPPGAPAAAIVPNGVPLDVFRPDGARADFALVLARICPEKGVHLALDAARRSGTPLLLGGRAFPYPEHLRYFREEVRPRLGPGARFLGPLSRREKARLLASARCLVVPSLAPETSSLVAMEALASGTPVVALRVGALPEIVDDGRTGFLVRSVDELADAIRASSRLSSADCRRAAEARFGADVMIRRYVELYRRLIRQGASRWRAGPPRARAAPRGANPSAPVR